MTGCCWQLSIGYAIIESHDEIIQWRNRPGVDLNSCSVPASLSLKDEVVVDLRRRQIQATLPMDDAPYSESPPAVAMDSKGRREGRHRVGPESRVQLVHHLVDERGCMVAVHTPQGDIHGPLVGVSPLPWHLLIEIANDNVQDSPGYRGPLRTHLFRDYLGDHGDHGVILSS